MTRTKGAKNNIMRYPVFYHIRVSEAMLKELKNMGGEAVRKILEKGVK